MARGTEASETYHSWPRSFHGIEHAGVAHAKHVPVRALDAGIEQHFFHVAHCQGMARLGGLWRAMAGCVGHRCSAAARTLGFGIIHRG